MIHADAASSPYELKRRGIAACDYIISGIPFSILKKEKKRALLRKHMTPSRRVAVSSFIR